MEGLGYEGSQIEQWKIYVEKATRLNGQCVKKAAKLNMKRSVLMQPD